LTALGVIGALANPKMTLLAASGVIDSNDDWLDHNKSNEVPVELRPRNVFEAAISTELEPGAYTVIDSGSTVQATLHN
jgi:hypothetical protein